jgi:hypothetical protein
MNILAMRKKGMKKDPQYIIAFVNPKEEIVNTLGFLDLADVFMFAMDMGREMEKGSKGSCMVLTAEQAKQVGIECTLLFEGRVENKGKKK